MSDSTLKPPASVDKIPLKPPAVAALSKTNLQLPISAPQKLNTGCNLTASGSATGNPRNKCALKPGYSLMGWIRLCNSGVDMSGTGRRVIPVTRMELAKHNKLDDAWMAIQGKVFNITRYMDYHPGGVDELMRGVGRDATKLFEEVHAWVNYPQLLAKCYVGPLKETVVPIKEEEEIIIQPPKELLPRFDWIQQRSELTLCFYTRRFSNPGWMLKRKATAEELEIRIQLSEVWHVFNFKLCHAVLWPPKAVRAGPETGKVEVVLVKQDAEPWSTYGTHEISKLDAVSDEQFEYEVVHCEPFSHDSFSLSLQSVKEQVLMHVPIGYHVDIEVPHNGELLQRSYTPVPHTCLPSNRAQIDEDSSPSMKQEFIVKHYEQGAVSSYLHQLKPGATVQLTLPRGSFVLSSLDAHRNILLLAAGSGLTPILSLLRPLLKRQINRLERLHLLYFNKTQSDIWLRDKLQVLHESDERFTCTHILSQAEDKVSQPQRICQELLAPFFKGQRSELFTYVAICGPTGFNSSAVDSLKELQFKMEQVHVFQG